MKIKILEALEHANNCERDFVDMEAKVHRCRHLHFFVAWFDVLGVCLDEEVVVVLMLYSVARNFCFSRVRLGADLYGGIVNAHSGSSVQCYQ